MVITTKKFNLLFFTVRITVHYCNYGEHVARAM